MAPGFSIFIYDKVKTPQESELIEAAKDLGEITAFGAKYLVVELSTSYSIDPGITYEITAKRLIEIKD